MSTIKKKTITTEEVTISVNEENKKEDSMATVAPKAIGRLDMVIAFEYFKPRKDGTTHFVITPEIIQHHAEMEEHQFDGITDSDKLNVWGMFGDNDTQVNSEALFLEHYTQVIHFHGEHRLNDDVTENVLIPLIRKIH